jgi:hypothetical protein
VWIYGDYVYHGAIGIMGLLSGTIATGLLSGTNVASGTTPILSGSIGIMILGLLLPDLCRSMGLLLLPDYRDYCCYRTIVWD